MNGLIQHGVTARAEAAPEATAIVAAGERMSYGALESAANRLARQLIATGCARGDRVGILMPKQPAAIVAMLASLKADAIYVPLDPAEPAARLARTLRSSECHAVLAAGPVAATLAEALATAGQAQKLLVGWLGEGSPPESIADAAFTSRDLAAFSAAPPPAANGGTDVAHILFTSGSTGEPKGVPITHASVLAFLRWALPYFGLGADDRVAQQVPLRFDLSTFDVFGALSAGSELHLVPAELNLQPPRLAAFMRDSQVTHWLAVPSILGLLAGFDAVGRGDFPKLRRLLFAGEVLPVPTLAWWMRRLPHVRFTNLYGPTETTIASSYYTVPSCPDPAAQPTPIGAACDGEELLVLDEELRPVADGVIGDIHIRGAGLSPGYWRDPEKSRAVFLEWPDGQGDSGRIYRTGDRGWRDTEGLYHYVGRADMQIKCRGYRIELGEIERALLSLPGLRGGAIVAIPSPGFEGSLICCAYVPAAAAGVSPTTLRAALAGLLPAYMLPMRWQRYETLTVNPNGKCDRQRLQRDFALAEEAAARAAGGSIRRVS